MHCPSPYDMLILKRRFEAAESARNSFWFLNIPPWEQEEFLVYWLMYRPSKRYHFERLGNKGGIYYYHWLKELREIINLPIMKYKLAPPHLLKARDKFARDMQKLWYDINMDISYSRNDGKNKNGWYIYINRKGMLRIYETLKSLPYCGTPNYQWRDAQKSDNCRGSEQYKDMYNKLQFFYSRRW